MTNSLKTVGIAILVIVGMAGMFYALGFVLPDEISSHMRYECIIRQTQSHKWLPLTEEEGLATIDKLFATANKPDGRIDMRWGPKVIEFSGGDDNSRTWVVEIDLEVDGVELIPVSYDAYQHIVSHWRDLSAIYIQHPELILKKGQ